LHQRLQLQLQHLPLEELDLVTAATWVQEYLYRHHLVHLVVYLLLLHLLLLHLLLSLDLWISSWQMTLNRKTQSPLYLGFLHLL